MKCPLEDPDGTQPDLKRPVQLRDLLCQRARCETWSRRTDMVRTLGEGSVLVLTEQGDKAAQCNLATCYLKGQGVEQDRREAIRWYAQAAQRVMRRRGGIWKICWQSGSKHAHAQADCLLCVSWYKELCENVVIISYFGFLRCLGSATSFAPFHAGQRTSTTST